MKCLLWTVPWLLLTSAAFAIERPNIVVILADDMGYSDAGCYGGEIATPNIDSLAAGGLRFSQFYNCARCCPTRASLLTGAYPHRVGLGQNGKTMDTSVPTLADRLKAGGYQTAMAGKWHLSELATTDPSQDRIGWMNHQVDLGIPYADPATFPTRRGFDRYYGVVWGVASYFDPFSLTDGIQPVPSVPSGYYLTDDITDHSVKYIEDFAKAKQPFFLYVAYTAPHWPLHARREEIVKYRGRYRGGWEVLRKERFTRQVELGLFDRRVPLGAVITGGTAWDDLTETEQAYQAAKMEVHAAMVDRLDQGIGRIVKSLTATGQLDNTLIIFLADNGASPEIPGKPGYDRNGQTRDGRAALRDKALQQPENVGKLGSDESYTGIGPAWANAVNTPLRYWKKESYDGGCRTPLIVHWTNALEKNLGGICTQVGHVMDIAPTCLHVARIEPTGEFEMDGKPLTRLLAGRDRDGHPALFFEHMGGKGMREGNWKTSALKDQPWELFDLAADPGETTNLAKQHPEQLKSMIAKWEAWFRRISPADAARKSYSREQSPPIANRALRIRCRVERAGQNGVILAEGGVVHGISLHLQDGGLVFSVRVDKRVSQTMPFPINKRRFDVEARLLADGKMELDVDGQTVATARASGLIPDQPADGLSIGFDDRSSVGHYNGSFPLDGVVEDVVIDEIK